MCFFRRRKLEISLKEVMRNIHIFDLIGPDFHRKEENQLQSNPSTTLHTCKFCYNHTCTDHKEEKLQLIINIHMQLISSQPCKLRLHQNSQDHVWVDQCLLGLVGSHARSKSLVHDWQAIDSL